VRENERGYTAAWVWVVGKRARVPRCKYMHYILENLSMAAQMEGNYCMTLKMGLGY
jgi:hypothetical protein